MMKTFVYRNLHRKCYSVKRNNKVEEHTDWACLLGPEPVAQTLFDGFTTGFKVHKSGRERVLREKRKNVHAFAWGYSIFTDPVAVQEAFEKMKPHMVQVGYNPYKAPWFYRKDTETPVGYAKMIFLTPDGVWTWQPTT